MYIGIRRKVSEIGSICLFLVTHLNHDASSLRIACVTYARALSTENPSLVLHRASHTARNSAASEMAAFHPGHLKRGNKGRFCCSRAFKSNHDNSSRLRRCCFGTPPSPFAQNDHFKAKIAPLPFIIIVLRRNDHGDPHF